MGRKARCAKPSALEMRGRDEVLREGLPRIGRLECDESDRAEDETAGKLPQEAGLDEFAHEPCLCRSDERCFRTTSPTCQIVCRPGFRNVSTMTLYETQR
jgi:hypothetical protein